MWHCYLIILTLDGDVALVVITLDGDVTHGDVTMVITLDIW